MSQTQMSTEWKFRRIIHNRLIQSGEKRVHFLSAEFCCYELLINNKCLVLPIGGCNPLAAIILFPSQFEFLDFLNEI